MEREIPFGLIPRLTIVLALSGATSPLLDQGTPFASGGGISSEKSPSIVGSTPLNATIPQRLIRRIYRSQANRITAGGQLVPDTRRFATACCSTSGATAVGVNPPPDTPDIRRSSGAGDTRATAAWRGTRYAEHGPRGRKSEHPRRTADDVHLVCGVAATSERTALEARSSTDQRRLARVGGDARTRHLRAAPRRRPVSPSSSRQTAGLLALARDTQLLTSSSKQVSADLTMASFQLNSVQLYQVRLNNLESQSAPSGTRASDTGSV
ncbi:hypothetical protein K1T71_008075 [Dendrolimus kikuchii]|uniref:Uncharacterized protein n=1 Tax=Dendrolimus kikuchii TaxID=765133 RepID=A0ACC1CWC3_9NEOP|nr:hypothetical protein K1T71_008075 [Dendrolimus kikuchii]